MGEAKAVESVQLPRTRASLAADLRALGLRPGMVVLVHSAMSRIGWINGGPVAAIQAMMDVLTETGTLVMPAFSAEYTDPALWQNPPVPESWWQIVRDTMPAFDPRITPTRQMGRIAETFRSWPGVLRSAHPSLSFAAWGHYAEQVTAGHTLDFPLGEGSPLARIYDLGGYVLLLGVGYGNCTSFHLAENRARCNPEVTNGGPILENGRRIWRTYRDYEENAEIFPEIGADWERAEPDAVRIGHVGSAECRLFVQPRGVDFALRWLLARCPKSTL